MSQPGKVGARLVVMSVALAAAILLFDLLLPLGVAEGVPYVALVLAGLWPPGTPWQAVAVGPREAVSVRRRPPTLQSPDTAAPRIEGCRLEIARYSARGPRHGRRPRPSRAGNRHQPPGGMKPEAVERGAPRRVKQAFTPSPSLPERSQGCTAW